MPGPTVIERLVADVARQIRLRRAEFYGLRGLFWGAVAAVLPLVLKESLGVWSYVGRGAVPARGRGRGRGYGFLLKLPRRRGGAARRSRLRASGSDEHRARVGRSRGSHPDRGRARRRRGRPRRSARARGASSRAGCRARPSSFPSPSCWASCSRRPRRFRCRRPACPTSRSPATRTRRSSRSAAGRLQQSEREQATRRDPVQRAEVQERTLTPAHGRRRAEPARRPRRRLQGHLAGRPRARFQLLPQEGRRPAADAGADGPAAGSPERLHAEPGPGLVFQKAKALRGGLDPNKKVSPEKLRELLRSARPAGAWLVAFFLVPIGIVAAYSIDIFSIYPAKHPVTLAGWDDFVHSAIYLKLFWKSVRMSLLVSVVVVLLAYPVAYYLALSGTKRKYVLLLILIAPFLTSYLLRVLAWKVILGSNGVVNSFLYWLGVRAPTIRSRSSSTAGSRSCSCSSTSGCRSSRCRSSFRSRASTGACSRRRPTSMRAGWQAFLRVTLPLSMPGVVAAFLFVFIPTVGEFVTPSLVGGRPGTCTGTRSRICSGPASRTGEPARCWRFPARCRRASSPACSRVFSACGSGSALMDAALSKNGRRMLRGLLRSRRRVPLRADRDSAAVLVQRLGAAVVPAQRVHADLVPAVRSRPGAARGARDECDRRSRSPASARSCSARSPRSRSRGVASGASRPSRRCCSARSSSRTSSSGSRCCCCSMRSACRGRS